MDPSHGRGDLRRVAERRPHLDRSRGALDRVTIALEREEQSVAAELQQVAAAIVGETQHRPEHPVEDLGQLLRSDTSAPGELLRQVREAGDVDEAEGALEAAPPLSGRV